MDKGGLVTAVIFVIGAIVVLITLFLQKTSYDPDQCPRMILGYKCHGEKRCDHSKAAVTHAKRVMDWC